MTSICLFYEVAGFRLRGHVCYVLNNTHNGQPCNLLPARPSAIELLAETGQHQQMSPHSDFMMQK